MTSNSVIPNKQAREKIILANKLFEESKKDMDNDSIILLEVLKVSNEAIQLDRNYYYIYPIKASVLIRLGKNQGAIHTIDNILKIQPYMAECYQYQEFIYEKLELHNLALKKTI